MLQNARVTAFTIFESLKETQQRQGVNLLGPPRLGLTRQSIDGETSLKLFSGKVDEKHQ